jgi:chaperonin GroES
MLKMPTDKVAITPIRDPDKSPGGIWIPDIAKERVDQGIVKYVGPDVKDIKIGMYVLFSGYTGTLLRLEGEGDLIIMSEQFIVCEIGEVDNIQVPGLYYRSRFNKEQAIGELADIILNSLPTYIHIDYDALQAQVLANKLAQELARLGCRGPVADPYYEADYENMFNFLAQAFTESKFVGRIKAKIAKPTLDELDIHK